jgi:hypothetical protein
LGIGDWGLGIGPNPQSPIPNPQSPIPNPHVYPIKYSNKKITKIIFFRLLFLNIRIQIKSLKIE